MREAERQLQQRGCRAALIGVLKFKAPTLLPFYEPQGYVDTKRRGKPEGLKEGCNQDGNLIIMVKAFELSS